MCAHNCTPNTAWSIKSNSEMHLMATVSIKIGESVTILYCDGTLPTRERRMQLKEDKDFDCSCDRCSSPSEMYSYFTGVKCCEKSCADNFYLLPVDRAGETWKCENCNKEKSREFIESIYSKIDADLNSLNLEDDFTHSAVERLSNVISKYAGVMLHQNHFKIYNMATELIQRISFLLSQQQSRNSKIKKRENKLVGLLLDYGAMLIHVTDIILPGLNRQRGIDFERLHIFEIYFIIFKFK